MKKLSFSDSEYGGKRKRTRREVFLSEMDRAVPWAKLERLVEPDYLKADSGRGAIVWRRCFGSTAFSNGTG